LNFFPFVFLFFIVHSRIKLKLTRGGKFNFDPSSLNGRGLGFLFFPLPLHSAPPWFWTRGAYWIQKEVPEVKPSLIRKIKAGSEMALSSFMIGLSPFWGKQR
jgi:hypothetical protein